MDHAERFRQLTCTQAVRADLSARSVRAAALTTIAGFTDFGVRIGSTALLARLIAPDHFGLLMMAMAVTSVADQLRELGLSTATVQQKEITHEQVSNLFWINVGASSGLALLLCAASPLIARYYHEPRLIAIACILSTTMVFGGLTVQHQALLTRRLQLGRTSSIRLASSLVSTALAIAMAWAGWGYWALLWREVARAALLAIGMWLTFPWIPGWPDFKTDVRKMLRFGADLTASNILGSFASGIDRFLLGRFWGATPVAMYRQAFQLVAAPTDQLLSPLYQVTQPSLSMLQGDPARFRRFYEKVLTLVCTITMPLSLFTAVYATELTNLLLGKRWVEAAPVLCILSFGTFIKQAVGSTAFVLVAMGESKNFLWLTILQSALVVVLMSIGVIWGVEAIALAEIATTYLMIVPRLRGCLHGTPISYSAFLRTICRPAFASIGMGFVLLALRAGSTNSDPRNLILGCVVAALAFATIWLLIPGGVTEFESLLGDIRTALRRRQSRTAAPEPIAAS